MTKIPYKRNTGNFERAKGIGHVPIIESEFIKSELGKFHIITQKTINEIPKELVFDQSSEIEKCTLPKYLLSFDGSPREVQIDERFPSTRIDYLQIAAVLVLMNKTLEQEKNRFIDPSKFRDAMDNAIQPLVLPGANIRRKDCDSLVDSWRYGIYEIFKSYEIEDLTLLDIFMTLLKYNPDRVSSDKVLLKRCSATKNCNKGIIVPVDGVKCHGCGKYLYPTDSLRIHEEVRDLQPNEGPLKRIMLILEHLYMIGYLEHLMIRKPEILKSMAFVIDGPLATFGPTAWVHRVIMNYINERVFNKLKELNYSFPLILGVEKTGSFAEHATVISKYLEPQTLMLLPEDYIYNYILSCKKPHSGEYGAETYYGQKFFYKTKNNQIFVVTIPRKRKGPFSQDILDHPTLHRTLKLLDHIGTIFYQDSLIPIALAHSFASIPLRTGSKVLKILSQRELNII